MITLYDYLPSQNAYKVRLLLAQLGRPYRTQLVSIFEGEGQTPEHRARNPTGAVPVLELEDGRTLAESNAILWYLAQGTPFLPADGFEQARVLQWLCFEADYVQSSIATLRHWVMTGKDARRPPAQVAGMRTRSAGVLGMLDRALAEGPFLVGGQYGIADIAVFAYVARAEEAGVSLAPFPAVTDWIARVQAQPGFLAQTYPYSIDPHSGGELS